MRQTADLTDVPYRRTGWYGTIAIPSIWYRIWLAACRKLLCILDCDHEIKASTVAVTTSPTGIRLTEPMAFKTVVINASAFPAQIFEKGALVATVPAGEAIQLPMTGKFGLAAMGVGGSVILTVTTFIRCDCGDYEYGYGTSTPIGSRLL